MASGLQRSSPARFFSGLMEMGGAMSARVAKSAETVGRATVCAAIAWTLLASPAIAAADDPAASDVASRSRASGGLAISRYFEDGARSVGPTEPALTLDFPATYVRRVLWDVGYVLTSPGRWERDDWASFGIVAAGTGALFGADRSIDIESRRRHPRSSSEKHIEDGIQNFGSFAGIAGVVGGAELFGFVTGNDGMKSLGADALEAVAISGLLTESLKEITGRERPNKNDGPFAFTPFSGSASFPSGHTTAAFSLAATISEHFGNDLRVAIPAYALATGVGLARTRADRHFATDVFLGAAIGVSTARTLFGLERDRRAAAGAGGGPSVSLGPSTVAGLPGVALAVRF